MGDIFLLSLVSAANASLLAAVTVMLFLPNPKPLLLGYFVAPERTVVEVQRFRAWLTRSGRRMAIGGAAGLGALLIVRGLIGYFA